MQCILLFLKPDESYWLPQAQLPFPASAHVAFHLERCYQLLGIAETTFRCGGN